MSKPADIFENYPEARAREILQAADPSKHSPYWSLFMDLAGRVENERNVAVAVKRMAAAGQTTIPLSREERDAIDELKEFSLFTVKPNGDAYTLTPTAKLLHVLERRTGLGNTAPYYDGARAVEILQAAEAAHAASSKPHQSPFMYLAQYDENEKIAAAFIRRMAQTGQTRIRVNAEGFRVTGPLVEPYALFTAVQDGDAFIIAPTPRLLEILERRTDLAKPDPVLETASPVPVSRKGFIASVVARLKGRGATHSAS